MAKQRSFKQWRQQRPFWGATLSLLAGLIILWVPVNLAQIAFLPGSMAFVGYLFGGLIIILSILVYIYPQFSSILGVFIMFFSVLSVMGALGGLFVGTILGIIGGSLAIAWRLVIEKDDVNKTRKRKMNRERRQNGSAASF